MADVLLIGGHRKSGTTMLTRLFDGHADVFVAPTDLNVLYAYYPEWVSDKYSIEEKRQRLHRVVLDEVHDIIKDTEKETCLDYEKFSSFFSDKLNTINLSEIVDIVNMLVNAYKYSIPNDKKLIIVKETSSEIYTNWLLRNNDWKFLHLVRDPRDNLSAILAGQHSYYAKMGNDYLDTVSSIITRYSYGIKWLKHNIEVFGNERYKSILFENVTKDVEKSMREIANWLSIEWDDSLLIPTYGSKRFTGNNFDEIKFNHVDNRHVGGWKHRIREEEAALIEFFLKEEMDYLGYRREIDQSIGAKAASELYAKMNYKYYFADRFV